MEKLYKCLKDFKAAGWKKDSEYTLLEEDALEAVEQGYLEEVPVDQTEAMIKRAVGDVMKTVASERASDAADIVAKVFAKLNVDSTAKGPVHVVVRDAERDKAKGIRDFLSLVGKTGLDTEPRVRDDAREQLFGVYAAIENKEFNEQYRKSIKRADEATIEAYAKMNGVTPAEYRKAALAEDSGTTGGYTVPTEYAETLLEVDPEDAVLVGSTDEYALTARELKMPYLNQTTPTGTVGQSSYFGGMIGQWTGEAALRQESEPTFKEITLVANEFSGYALASNNLLFDNKVALEQRLTRLFREMTIWYRDYAYLRGDGVAKPRGIMNAPATLSVTRAAANKISYADICSMYGKLLPQSVKTAYWVIQQSAITSMLQMVDPSNRLVIQPYYPGTSGGPATVRPAMTMLGLPIKTTEKVSTLGTAGDLMLVDPKQYFTATRKDIEIASSLHYKFLNNQITFRYIFRGDGEPWMDAPLTLQDQTTQISPFVILS